MGNAYQYIYNNSYMHIHTCTFDIPIRINNYKDMLKLMCIIIIAL